MYSILEIYQSPSKPQPAHNIATLPKCSVLPLYARPFYVMLNPFHFPRSKVHRNSHTITMHQQHRRQPPKQHLQITHIPQTICLAPERSFDRRWQRREDDGCVVAVLRHQIVENQMLGARGKGVEGEGEGCLGRIAGCWCRYCGHRRLRRLVRSG